MRTTMDYVVAIIVGGALVIGLGSMLIGKVVEVWDWFMSRLSTRPAVRSVKLPQQTSRQTTQTDQQTPRPSATLPKLPRFALDRTRAAVLEELLTHGWTVTDLRREGILRGDNVAIGHEVTEARARLGLSDPERTFKVRDSQGEREIPIDERAVLTK